MTIDRDHMMNGWEHRSIAELPADHAAIIAELRRRDVLRSANNPTGDFAEYLFCRAFDWVQEKNSAKGFDAIGRDGTRFQIKARRIHDHNRSRQLSAIHDLDGFDVLAGVIFDDIYRVIRAALIPAAVGKECATYIKHTNSYKFLLRDGIWDIESVKNVTGQLADAGQQQNRGQYIYLN